VNNELCANPTMDLFDPAYAIDPSKYYTREEIEPVSVQAFVCCEEGGHQAWADHETRPLSWKEIPADLVEANKQYNPEHDEDKVYVSVENWGETIFVFLEDEGRRSNAKWYQAHIVKPYEKAQSDWVWECAYNLQGRNSNERVIVDFTETVGWRLHIKSMPDDHPKMLILRDAAASAAAAQEQEEQEGDSEEEQINAATPSWRNEGPGHLGTEELPAIPIDIGYGSGWTLERIAAKAKIDMKELWGYNYDNGWIKSDLMEFGHKHMGRTRLAALKTQKNGMQVYLSPEAVEEFHK